MSDFKVLDVDLAFDVDFKGRDNQNVYCPHCEHPETSKTKSCSVSRSGFYNCMSCGISGSAIQFYAHVFDLTVKEAEDALTISSGDPTRREESYTGRRFNTQASRPMPSDIISRCVNHLYKTKEWLHYLKKERGLSLQTLNEYEIGSDEYRITIPIFDDEDDLANIRRYLPHAGEYPKMVSHTKGDPSPRLYPVHILRDLSSGNELIICEGEWDALLLNQNGFPAITNTGQVSIWNMIWTRRLKDFKIVVIFDVNDKKENLGQRMAYDRAYEFNSHGAKVKIVELPLSNEGGDITDYFVGTNHTAADLRKLIDNTPPFDPNHPKALEARKATSKQRKTQSVTLHDAANAEYYYQNIHMRCLVAGKGTAPYILPKQIEVTITNPEKTRRKEVHTFSLLEGTFLSMLGTSDAGQHKIIRAHLRIPKSHSLSYEVLESFNVEEVYLIPAIDYESKHGQYTMRKAYYLGHGIETNREYDFSGYTLPDPKTQQATHVLTEAHHAETDIDTFELTKDTYKSLKKTFQDKDPFRKLSKIADELATHVTKIYGRADLHTAVDLVFHSPLYFDFDGTRVRKGWLECLIIGDTRTGKGFVTEGLSKHYRVGEVISGENVSTAGLVGAVQRIGDRWTLVWGKIPLADKRLIIIDECASLSTTDIGKLSRIRSEGLAEITKIISEKTTARTRLIWIGNPRPHLSNGHPRSLADYNYGVEAISELMGAAEDVSRFDFALVVAQNEVASKDINKHHVISTDLTYTSDLCQQLIMWTWSRKPEQIIFEEGVTDLTLRAAQDLGKKFSPKAYLIQAEDVRFKLARIACAVAARTFSTDDGTNIIVKKAHMEFAYNFLHHIYSKTCCGYAQMSKADREHSHLQDEDGVYTTLQAAGDYFPDLVRGLMEQRTIAARDMCDYAGVDIHQARVLVSDLVRYRALIKEYSYYIKTPAFKTYLRNLRATLSDDEHVTEPEPEDIQDEEQQSIPDVEV